MVKTSPASLIWIYDFKYYYRLISVVRITNFIGEYNQKKHYRKAFRMSCKICGIAIIVMAVIGGLI